MVNEAVNELEQSTLSKAVKNVKQKLLTKEKKTEIKISTEISPPKTEQPNFSRGIVYLGHIPHGFFEDQMRDYFKQFGRVTRVRLVRSKNTGRSRGYGYVEFVHTEVAKIAAESMNNYLMSGRLLKATYIPPEKQHARFFIGRQWSKQNYPRLINRAKQNTQKNKNIDNKVEASLVQRGLSKISNIEKKLAAVGIDYKIEPVEVPTPVVKKRKAAAPPPSTEMKKRKIASQKSTVQKTKKEIEVVEPFVQKIKKKDTADEIVARKIKNNVEPKIKSTKKNKLKIISNISLAPQLEKKILSEALLMDRKKQPIQTSEKRLPKKSIKKSIAKSHIDAKLVEKVSSKVPIVKKLKKAKVATVESVKETKISVAAPVSDKVKQQKAKKSSGATPAIEKSIQKKISLLVPSVKKSKLKTGVQPSLKNKGNKKKKSIAA